MIRKQNTTDSITEQDSQEHRVQRDVAATGVPPIDAAQPSDVPEVPTDFEDAESDEQLLYEKLAWMRETRRRLTPFSDELLTLLEAIVEETREEGCDIEPDYELRIDGYPHAQYSTRGNVAEGKRYIRFLTQPDFGCSWEADLTVENLIVFVEEYQYLDCETLAVDKTGILWRSEIDTPWESGQYDYPGLEPAVRNRVQAICSPRTA
jgi:hypothetical protein